VTPHQRARRKWIARYVASFEHGCTVKAAADLIGCTERSVIDLAKAGHITILTSERFQWPLPTVVDQRSVEAYVQRREQEQGVNPT
jgi:hypothetical protein